MAMASSSLLRLWICLAAVLAVWITRVQAQSIIISGSGVFAIGDRKTLVCALLTTSESDTLTWTSDGVPLAGAVSLPTTNLGTSYSVKSQYTFDVAASHHQKAIRCSSGEVVATWVVVVYQRPSPPVISGPTVVDEGTNATWQCISDNGAGSEPSITWQSGSTYLQPSLYSKTTTQRPYSSTSTLAVFKVTSTLTMPIAESASSFQLTCRAEQSTTGSITTAFYSVTVNTLPQVTAPTTSYTSRENTDITLDCSISSPANFVVKWFKNGALLNTSSSRYLGATPSDPRLTIRGVQKEDAGSYVCKATNSLGSKNSSAISLVVEYKPRITHTANPVNGVLNSDVDLSCVVDSHPAYTTLYWYRVTATTPTEVRSLISSTSNPSKYSGGTTSTPTLTIRSLATTDEGLYRCRADNNVGAGFGERVRVEVLYAPTTPSVTLSKNEYDEGDVITLTCSSNGYPTPQYAWSHKEQAVGTASSTYTVASATPGSRGAYRCTATNTVGSATTTVNVVVNYKPRAGTITNVKATVGETVTLTCAVDAYPPAHSYTWTKDGVTKGAASGSEELTVTVETQGDFGDYQCRATNSRGQSDPITVKLEEDDGGNTGESTEGSGLSMATLILIIVICIILLIIIILIIIYCCASGRCPGKRKNNVSPSVVAGPVVPAEEKPFGEKPPKPVAAISSTPNGHVASARPATPRSSRSTRNGHVGDTPPAAKTPDPAASQRNGTASLGHGMSISVPGLLTPRPHHLPPLGHEGEPEETESAEDSKHRRKKRRARPNTGAAPQNNLQV